MKKKIISIICIVILLGVVSQYSVSAKTEIRISDDEEGYYAITIQSIKKNIEIALFNGCNEIKNYTIEVFFLKPFGLVLFKNRLNRSLVVYEEVNKTINPNESKYHNYPVNIRFGMVFIIVMMGDKTIGAYGIVLGRRAFFKASFTYKI